MNFNFLIWEQGWQTAGWTMVFFLALGTLVVLLAAPLRWLLRSADPTFRYTTSLAVFAVLALLPVGIVLWLSQMPASELPLAELAPTPMPQIIDLADTPFEADATAVRLQAPNELVPSEPTENATAWTVAQAVEYFPWVWLIGAALTFLLLATGLIGAERLRRASQIVDAGPVHKAAERLRTALGVGRRVTVAICDRLATPLVVGIVRPLILLPPAALTGWSTDELEMVLLHELAHIRRWDNLVNLLQRVVESLLFFHPAVWFVSRWVSRDREDFCDAGVVVRSSAPDPAAR
jgi:beta-lactamase regulating signal transducer with metallopeptidase domain